MGASDVSSDEIMGDVEGQTVATAFLRTVAIAPEAVALRWLEGEALHGHVWRAGLPKTMKEAA